MKKIYNIIPYIIAFAFIYGVSIVPASAEKTKIVLKDKYQRVQFTITKDNGKTIVKDRKGFAVRKFTTTTSKVNSSYFRFNSKRVK